MSKEKTNESQPDILYGTANIITDYSFQHLEGRLLTLIETLGLQDKQEAALKGLVRQEIWTMVSQDAFPITGEQHTKVRMENVGFGQTSQRPSLPN